MAMRNVSNAIFTTEIYDMNVTVHILLAGDMDGCNGEM